MSDVRCRACGAAVPVEAQWCSLCFADLRPPPVRTPEPASEPEREVVSVAAPASQAVPAARAASAPAPSPGPAVAPGPKRQARWPCPRCGASMPMSEDACSECGTGFLSGATMTTPTHLPLIGDVGRMSQIQRLMIGLGISVALVVVFLLLSLIVGHIF